MLFKHTFSYTYHTSTYNYIFFSSSVFFSYHLSYFPYLLYFFPSLPALYLSHHHHYSLSYWDLDDNEGGQRGDAGCSLRTAEEIDGEEKDKWGGLRIIEKMT